MITKSNVAVVVTALLTVAQVQAANAGPNCAAELFIQKGVGKSAIEHFTARGASNQKAYLQARRCVEMHWASRWDRKKPGDCKTAKQVDNYGLNDLKKWIENRSCEKGWKSGNVKLVFRSKGGAGCAKKVTVASYKMQNRYCN